MKSVGEEFVYDTRVDYLDEEPFVQNSTQIRPKIWGANRLLVAFDSIGIVAEYTLNPEPRKVDELVVGDHLYGLYQYGSQIVAFGEDYITFIESTVLGMEITKQISREAKPFDDFGTHDDQQYIVGDVLYDVQRTLDSESVLVAWDLLATSSNQALLGVSEPAPHSDINVSGSTRHEIAASVGNRERAIALFSMTVPPEYLGSLSLEDYMTNPNASARHVISGDWLLVTISVAGGSDEGYFVFDISKEPLECLVLPM